MENNGWVNIYCHKASNSVIMVDASGGRSRPYSGGMVLVLQRYSSNALESAAVINDILCRLAKRTGNGNYIADIDFVDSISEMAIGIIDATEGAGAKSCLGG